jgi:hypothetical protein
MKSNSDISEAACGTDEASARFRNEVPAVCAVFGTRMSARSPRHFLIQPSNERDRAHHDCPDSHPRQDSSAICVDLTRFDRIRLHLRCLCRDHKYLWHFAGVWRELRLR